MATLKGKIIVSLVGYQGSGKSTLGKLLAETLLTEHIETSYVVRSLLGEDMKREELALTGDITDDNPNWLGQALEEVIFEVYEDINPTIVVLTGVREKEVYDYFLKRKANLYSFEINSPAETRFWRLMRLGKCKSAKSFVLQELRERELGLDKITEMSQFTVPTSEATRPHRLIKAMIKTLKEQDVLV